MRGPTRPGGEAGPLGPAQCPPQGTRLGVRRPPAGRPDSSPGSERVALPAPFLPALPTPLRPGPAPASVTGRAPPQSPAHPQRVPGTAQCPPGPPPGWRHPRAGAGGRSSRSGELRTQTRAPCSLPRCRPTSPLPGPESRLLNGVFAGSAWVGSPAGPLEASQGEAESKHIIK